MSLRAIQESMRSALHDRDAKAFLAHLDPAATERFRIYAGMYFTRLIGALEQDFPATLRLLGHEIFERVCVTHVKRCPSRHPSLAWLGRGFEETLHGLGLDREAAVARLEWAKNEAFWAPDATPMLPQALGALGEDLAIATLAFHPSVGRADIALGVRPFVDGDVDAAIDLARTEPIVVWRRGHVVVERTLGAAEAVAFDRARAGEPVGAFCEAFLGEPDPDGAAISALTTWLVEGWVCSAERASSADG